MEVRSLGLVDEGLLLLGRPLQRIQVVPISLLPSARADDLREIEDLRSPVRGETIDLSDALADEEPARQVAQVRPGGGQDGGRCLRI